MPMVKRDGEHVPVTWDEAWEVVAAGLGRGDRAQRARVAGRVRRQPDRPQPLGDDVLTGAAHRARDPAPVQRLDGRSDASSRRVRLRVRLARGDRRTGPRPHRSPRDPRRQPVCLERQRVHRSGLPGSHRGDPGAGRQGRRRRSSTVAHRGTGRPVGVDPAGHRRAAARSDREHDAGGGTGRPW